MSAHHCAACAHDAHVREVVASIPPSIVWTVTSQLRDKGWARVTNGAYGIDRDATLAENPALDAIAMRWDHFTPGGTSYEQS